MAVSTVGEYLSALEKSKLLNSEQLVEAQRLAGELPDAAELAKALARKTLVSRWQASVLLDRGPRAQLHLGKYKLIQPLGKGGMGTVFLAEHVTMNRRVALKIVPRSIAKNRASLDRFFAEARAIAALDHPNIVQAYSVDNEMDRYFIVMEYVDGQDLQRFVELNGPLDFASAADYIRQAAEGLAHAHARNLVHCDIKPSNLLVNNQGVIKILDLGLVRLNRSDEPRRSATGEPAFGTVDYMAPEQAMETTNFDHRADIYSLGCTLYFLLAGHPPFAEGTLAQRIVRHQTQEPRDILLERPNTPPKLVEICKRMMSKQPENRYQSTQEVCAVLAAWQNGSDGATGGRVPLPVKPLEDTALVAVPADDWLSFLEGPSTSSADSNGLKTPGSSATIAKLSKSGKQPIKKGQVSGGIAMAPTGVWAILGWFNTTQRKIVGVLGGIALLAVVAGLTSLPFLLPHPKPPAQVARQPKPQEKKTPLEEDVGSPPDKSAEKNPDASKDLLSKNSPEDKTNVTNKPTQAAEKPSTIVPPKPAETVKPANKTDAPAETKTDGNSAAKPDVKPAPPENKTEPPPKPVEPPKPVSLDGLVASVNLPQPGRGGNEAVSLGKLDLDPKLALDVRLLGGDTVAKGNPTFEVQKDSDGTAKGWSVQMADRNKDAVKIARVWQEENEWRIQWSDEARDKATLIRYCGLQFSCEKRTHFVALTAPKIVPPLSINVDTGVARTRLNRDFPLPDPSVLRLQILPLDAALPKSQIKILEGKARGGRPVRGKPAEPVFGNKVSAKGHVFVTLTKENVPRIAMEIAFDARGKDVLLDMQAGCEILGNLPLNFANLQGTAERVGAYLMMNDSDKNPNKKNMQAQIEAAKATRDQLKALAELATELNQKRASIPFCVYAVLGKGDDEASPKVVIFQSGQVENPKAGGTKKNPKGKQPKGRAAPDIDERDLK